MEFLVFAPVVIGFAAIVIGVAMQVREERQKERKIIELEIELALAKEKLTVKRTMDQDG